jgi:hypothetical protein
MHQITTPSVLPIAMLAAAALLSRWHATLSQDCHRLRIARSQRRQLHKALLDAGAAAIVWAA